MSYQKERERFIAQMSSKLSLTEILYLLKSANTYQRLAVRECNGDDDLRNEFTACPLRKNEIKGICICDGTEKHERVTKSAAKMYRLEQRLRDLFGARVEFQGDPRGCTLKFDGEGVPSRNY